MSKWPPSEYLTKKETKLNWSQECEEAFNKLKAVLTSDNVLVYYDLKLPVTLAGDASAYGIEA